MNDLVLNLKSGIKNMSFNSLLGNMHMCIHIHIYTCSMK